MAFNSAENSLKRRSLLNWPEPQKPIIPSLNLLPLSSVSLHSAPSTNRSSKSEGRVTPRSSPRNASDGAISSLVYKGLNNLHSVRRPSISFDLNWQGKIDAALQAYLAKNPAPSHPGLDQQVGLIIRSFFPWINGLIAELESVFQTIKDEGISKSSRMSKLYTQIEEFALVCDSLQAWEKIPLRRRVKHLKAFYLNFRKIEEKQAEIYTLGFWLSKAKCFRSNDLERYLRFQKKIQRVLNNPSEGVLNNSEKWEVCDAALEYPIKNISLQNIQRSLFEGVKWIRDLKINGEKLDFSSCETSGLNSTSPNAAENIRHLAKCLISQMYKRGLRSESNAQEKIDEAKIEEFTTDFVQHHGSHFGAPNQIDHQDVMRLMTLNAWAHVDSSLRKRFRILDDGKYGITTPNSMQASLYLEKSPDLVVEIVMNYWVHERLPGGNAVDKSKILFEVTAAVEWRPEYKENDFIWKGQASIRSVELFGGAGNEDIAYLVQSILQPKRVN
jgi:hypothetical protein